MALAVLAFGLGFLGIFFDERRRAWDDRLSGVDVLYEGRRAQAGTVVAPRRPRGGRDGCPLTAKAPGTRGLRAQRVAGSSL